MSMPSQGWGEAKMCVCLIYVLAEGQGTVVIGGTRTSHRYENGQPINSPWKGGKTSLGHLNTMPFITLLMVIFIMYSV